MAELTKSFKKEEVYYFAREVSSLLELLNGTLILSKTSSKKIAIENQMSKIETLLYKYKPTIYEEYSFKTKYAYNNMVEARKEYDRVVAEKCFKETIDEYRIAYENSIKEYERLKNYRNKLKDVLENRYEY